jgi:lytic cellulose monooxygenase (C1-hydroxylating)
LLTVFSQQNADKTKLKFFSIGQAALVDSAADIWAGNIMIKNNFTWFIKIPTAIAPGNYVLRHDMVALHAAGQTNGAQNYPFCFNLAISSKGTDNPAGQVIQGMFKAEDPGIKFDLFARKGGSYPMPGVSGRH